MDADSGLLTLNTTLDKVESDFIEDYQICSIGYIGSCSNWTFFSGLAVSVSIVEAGFPSTQLLTRWRVIPLKNTRYVPTVTWGHALIGPFFRTGCFCLDSGSLLTPNKTFDELEFH